MSTPKNDDVKITFGTAPSTPGVEGESIVLYDDQGQFREAHSYGNFVEKIEGGVRVFRPDGVTISIVDGDITMEHLIPKSVGIRDISEVESLTVRTVDETRIYRVEFFEGGHIEVVYSQEGDVMEFTGQNVSQTLSQNNDLMISRYRSPED